MTTVAQAFFTTPNVTPDSVRLQVLDIAKGYKFYKASQFK